MSVQLNEQQLGAVAALRSGVNFLLTGEAGTGKTVTLKAMIQDCVNRQHPHAVTASTGIAATLLGGRTIHSWSGLHLGTDSVATILDKFRYRNTNGAKERIQTCKTLFIDEITLLTPDFFMKLDLVCRDVRQSNKPVGGIQLVLSGDFFQLGAIISIADRESNDAFLVHKVFMSVMRRLGEHHAAFSEDIMFLIASYWSPTYTDTELMGRYLFLCPTWTSTILHHIYLSIPYRQTDESFLALLKRARHAQLNKDDDTLFRSRIGKEPEDTKIHVPLLHPFVKHVQAENSQCLQRLSERTTYVSHSLLQYQRPTGTLVFDPRSNRNTNHYAYKKVVDFAKHLLVTPVLKLKIGAPIIMVHNNSTLGIANGQRGIVSNIILSHRRSLKQRTRLLQHDVALDDTTDAVEVILEGRPQPLRLTKHVFRMPELDSERALDPQAWTRSFQVVQFPFNLCFALTIHKSQGQSLTAARVYLGKSIRSYGQAYVALSRVMSLEGLCVEEYDRSAFITDPVVEDFYKRIIAS